MFKHDYINLHGIVPVLIILMFSLFSSQDAHAVVTADSNSAVIFVYQHIGDEHSPQSSLSLDQFKAHLRELKAGDYNIVPLRRIVKAMQPGGKSLPPKTVAITFDGAWTDTIQKAVPLLKKNHTPFTIFFASGMADSGQARHLNWEQLKVLKKKKYIDLGILPAAYTHMIGKDEAKNTGLINRAVARFREVFEEEPVFFAWPYGEYPDTLKESLTEYNFQAAFSLQSGVVHTQSDVWALPRFLMTDQYGDIDRFRLTANALPLPVVDIMPESATLTENPPMIGFTVTSEIEDLSRLSCFVSDVGKVGLFKLGGNRVEIRLDAPLPDRRTRVNCTIPANTEEPGEDKRWRWLGMILVSAGA